jgi:hypothetical protein
MSFLTEISSLKDQLQIAQNLHNTSVVLDEYSRIYDALGGKEKLDYLALVNAITRFKVLKEFGIISNYDQVTLLLREANDAFIIFNESWLMIGHKVRQNANILTDCKTHITDLKNQLNTLNDQCWQQWINSLEKKRYVDPIALESLKNIPNMLDIYEKFIRLKNEIKSSSRDIPTDLTDFQTIQQKNEELIVLKNQMSFNFDQEIKDFFDDLSVAGSNQVALSKYTKKVAAYLEANNSLGQYVIIRLGN